MYFSPQMKECQHLTLLSSKYMTLLAYCEPDFEDRPAIISGSRRSDVVNFYLPN
jgi:hypothetical protein